MRFKKEKQGLVERLFFNPKFLVLLGILGLAFLLFSLSGKLEEKRAIDREISLLETEISQIEKENQDLEKLINYLKSDQFVEEQARLNFGLKKPGEEVLVIKEGVDSVGLKVQDNKDQLNIKSSETNTEEFSFFANLEKWWYYFFSPTT